MENLPRLRLSKPQTTAQSRTKATCPKCRSRLLFTDAEDPDRTILLCKGAIAFSQEGVEVRCPRCGEKNMLPPVE